MALAAVRLKAVVLLLLIRCWLLLPLWEYVIVLCFVVRYFASILVLQSSWWRRESWLLCFVCLPGVSWLLCGSSSRCHGFLCSLWFWYFLITLTYYFCGVLCSSLFWYPLLYVISSFAITLTRKRDLVTLLFIVFRVSSYCKYPVALPHGVVGGYSVCDCCISWSYSLFSCVWLCVSMNDN